MNLTGLNFTTAFDSLRKNANLWAVPLATTGILIGLVLYHFPAFHILAELFSIIISFMLFSISWAGSNFHKNKYLDYIGCGYFWIGFLDMAHALTYKGVNFIVEGSGNLSSQFWIGTRYLEMILLLSALFITKMTTDKRGLLVGFGAGAASFLAMIMAGAFPATFVEGSGLTPFKIYSEYVIIAGLAVTFVLLKKRARLLAPVDVNLIAAAIVFKILSELMFTLYADVYDINNLMGHLLKIVAFWLMYQAVVVTSLIKPYEDLEESRNYNRRLFDSSSIGLALSRMDGTLIDVNPAYAQIVGRTVDETVGMTFWQLTPDKYASAEQGRFEALRTTGRYGPYIKEYIHKDGHLVPVQLSSLIIESNGEPCIWSNVEDISVRVKTESARRELVERVRKLAAHLPGFIFQYRLRPDGTSHFPYASEGIRRIYGCSPEDVSEDASAVFSVLHPDDIEHIKERIQTSAEELTYWHDEYRVVLPNGQTRWLEGSATPLKDDDGGIIWYGYIQDVSDRVAIRQEIARQRDRFATYIDVSGAMVVALDASGNIDLINDFACKLLGCDKGAVEGGNWFDNFVPDDVRDDARRRVTDMLEGDRDLPRTGESLVLTRSGERRLVAWNYATLLDETGKSTGVLASGIDVTDERDAQAELERSNRALQTISLCNEALVHASNEEHLLNSICRIVVENGGYNTAWTAFLRDNKGPHFVVTTSFGENKQMAERASLMLNERKNTDFYNPIRLSSNDDAELMRTVKKICPGMNVFDIHVLPLKEYGKTFGALFLVADDTKMVNDQEYKLLNELVSDLSYGIQALRVEREREYAMEKLAESEERSIAIVESAHDAIIAIDAHGHITQFNPAAQAMFGYTMHEALGQDVDIIIPDRFRADHKGAIRKYAQTREEHIFGKNLELSGLRSDGREFPIELTLSPMPKNTPDLCTAIIRDISDREEADRQRRQAQNMESLGNLAGGMAHDINNMLLPILNLTNMVKRTLRSGSGEEKKLSMVIQAAERVQGLVKRVLEFSRQEEADFKDQDIHDIVLEAMPLIRSTTPSSIEIETDFEDFPGIVNADAKQIHAALINLISNASDAIGMRNGAIGIDIKKVMPGPNVINTIAKLRATPYAKISVSDDGCGMTPEILNRAFDPFFTTKEPGKGTGLGLSMIHGIVMKHGGAISLHSEPGKGTRVDLYFPLVENT